MGTEMVTQGTGAQTREMEVDRFRPTNQMKLRALLKSVSQEGRQVLISVVFRSPGADSTYNGPLTLLIGHFNREESLFASSKNL